MFPFLLRKEVEDEYSQENFLRIQDYFKSQALDRCGFKFITIEVPGAVTNQAFQHRLGFVPKDILVLQNSQNVTLTWNWSAFTSTDLVFTTSGATSLRLLVGRYE